MFSNIYVLICIFHLLLHNIMSYSDELSHDREAHKVNQSYMCYLGNPRSFMENNIGLSTCFRPYIFFWSLTYNLHIPLKTNMGPEHYSFEKEINLPNLLCLGSTLVLGVCTCIILV